MTKGTTLLRPLALTAIAAAFMLTPSATAGLVIGLDYSSGTAAAQFGANFAAMQAAMTYAAQQYRSIYNDPIHVNIKVEGVAGTATLGASNTFLNSISYANLVSALGTDAKSPDDFTMTGAGGSIPAVDPIGSSHTYFLSTAQSKALGVTADNLSNDGTVKFGAGWTYTFDPNTRAVAGAIDFIGVAEHEISEVMGRIGLNGATVGTTPNSYSLADILSFTGPGARNIANTSGSFSIDNGTTLIKAFNNAAADPGTDSRDWAAGTNDSYNARSSASVKNDLSAADIRLMDVLGYDLAAPEPASALLILSGLVIAAGLRKKLTRS